MNILQTLGVNNLSLRGKGNEFNSFSRLFKNKSEALQAVVDGDYNPTEGITNAVIILGEGIMIYSFDLQDFVHISEFMSASNQANRYIKLDGVNDYIEFTDLKNDTNNILDFTKDWTIGITLVGVTGYPTAQNMTLFSRGGTHITLKAQEGSTNWGLYVTSKNDLYNTDGRAQANTWQAPNDFSRILFSYSKDTKRLRYIIGDPSTGSYVQRANLAIPQSMIDSQIIDDSLCIGKSWGGVGGSNFSGQPWNGGFNNLIISNIHFNSPFEIEFFQTGEDFKNMELYGDVVSYCKLGEDVYPEVSDEKDNMTGVLVNGTESDFVDIPDE